MIELRARQSPAEYGKLNVRASKRWRRNIDLEHQPRIKSFVVGSQLDVCLIKFNSEGGRELQWKRVVAHMIAQLRILAWPQKFQIRSGLHPHSRGEFFQW